MRLCLDWWRSARLGSREAMARVLPYLRCAAGPPADTAASAHSAGRRNRYMLDATALERVLKRDRLITALALGALTALAWLYAILAASLGGANMAGGASHMAMPHDHHWRGVPAHVRDV